MLYVSVENPLVCGLSKELCKRESQMKLENHEMRNSVGMDFQPRTAELMG